MSISYLEAIEREERNQADAARLLRDAEAEECAKISIEVGKTANPAGWITSIRIAEAIRSRIAARAKETSA